MAGILRESIGAKVTKVEFVHDYVTVFFNDSSLITITNSIECSLHSLVDLTGLTLLDVIRTDHAFTFSFDKGATLSIRMGEQDSFGDEAFHYRSPTGVDVIETMP